MYLVLSAPGVCRHTSPGPGLGEGGCARLRGRAPTDRGAPLACLSPKHVGGFPPSLWPRPVPVVCLVLTSSARRLFGLPSATPAPPDFLSWRPACRFFRPPEVEVCAVGQCGQDHSVQQVVQPRRSLRVRSGARLPLVATSEVLHRCALGVHKASAGALSGVLHMNMIKHSICSL